MAHITTENNYKTFLCSRCGQEVKVDITSGVANGMKNWYIYSCPHCGSIGSVEIEPEHRAYNLDEILEMNKHKENSLEKIADSLDEIKDLLKECLK